MRLVYRMVNPIQSANSLSDSRQHLVSNQNIKLTARFIICNFRIWSSVCISRAIYLCHAVIATIIFEMMDINVSTSIIIEKTSDSSCT